MLAEIITEQRPTRGLSERVDRLRLAFHSAQRAQVRHDIVGEDKSVILKLARSGGNSHNLAGRIKRERLGESGADGGQVGVEDGPLASAGPSIQRCQHWYD